MLQQSKIKIFWGGKAPSMLQCPEQPRPPVFRCCLQIRFISLVVIKEQAVLPETFSANAQPNDFWVCGLCKSIYTLIQTRNGILAVISTLLFQFQHTQPSWWKNKTAVFQLYVPTKGKVESLPQSWSLSLDLLNPVRCFKNSLCCFFLFLFKTHFLHNLKALGSIWKRRVTWTPLPFLYCFLNTPKV